MQLKQEWQFELNTTITMSLISKKPYLTNSGSSFRDDDLKCSSRFLCSSQSVHSPKSEMINIPKPKANRQNHQIRRLHRIFIWQNNASVVNPAGVVRIRWPSKSKVPFKQIVLKLQVIKCANSKMLPPMVEHRRDWSVRAIPLPL